MTDDNQDREDTYKEGINHHTTNIGASTVSTGRFGSVDTTSVHIKDDEISWLAGRLQNGRELHAETVELETNKGTFVFSADGENVVVRLEDKDDSG